MQDAAELYERAGLHDRAATIYIQARAFALAAPLMALITHNPKLQLEFAKAKESKLPLEHKVSQVLHECGGIASLLLSWSYNNHVSENAPANHALCLLSIQTVPGTSCGKALHRVATQCCKYLLRS